jgi:hypothetical protein
LGLDDYRRHQSATHVKFDRLDISAVSGIGGRATQIMAKQADPSKESEKKIYTKMTSFFNKKDTLTDEQFHRYWDQEHGPLFASLPYVQENLLKYNQVGPSS